MTKSILLEAGEKFGRLTVIKLDHIEKNNFNKNIEFYLCKCDCGNEKIISKNPLKLKRTQSCGCLLKESYKNKRNKLKNIRIYNIFNGMKTRCYNKNRKNYNNWGGRGIIICQEWLNDFMKFQEWSLSNGYQDNLSIDRIDNNGNYEPSNCRWVDNKEQSRNRRNNIMVYYNNRYYCIGELSILLGKSWHVVFNKFFKKG